ncbi:MAG TPA: CpsD/CapB family tyrosine-protein kinase [Nevskia sp.]|nr:CpsD/CapB family tyrosine-protein kinase [Nevskia sp.]
MNGISAERAPRVEAEEIPHRYTSLRPAGTPHLGLADSATRMLNEEHSTPPMAIPGRGVRLAHDPYHVRSETVRALRTELLLRHDTPELANALVLISPGSAEGRSQLAAELAVSFAQLGRRTLLVDADLRRPQQHLLFGLPHTDGLMQALAHGTTPLLNPVKGLSRMFLLSAGGVPSNPLELLSEGHFAGLVEQWRRDFEFVVFDTPPLSRCADGLAVATVVGRVLALGRADHTANRQMRDMFRRLATTQAQILGAVLNRF